MILCVGAMLCTASIHGFKITSPLPRFARSISVSTTVIDLGRYRSAGNYPYRPVTVQGGCWLALTNHGSGSERANRMVLVAQVRRDVPDGMAIPVAAFQLIPHINLLGCYRLKFHRPVSLLGTCDVAER